MCKKIVPIGIGTYLFANRKEDFVKGISIAISTGYRFFDTAPNYFCEEWLGESLREAINEGTVKREDVFLQSKFDNEYPYGYYDVLKSFDESLNRLQVDYLDGYLIHKPVPYHCEKNYVELNLQVWEAMHKLQNEGKIRKIGVSNFAERHIESLCANGLNLPQINQIEINPFFQQIGLVNWCQNKGIEIQAWSPLARGEVFSNEILRNLALSKGVSIAQISIKWLVERNI